MQYQHLKSSGAERGVAGQEILAGNKTLAGHKILVTRAAHQAAKLVQGFESAGAEVIALPLIEILPPASWEEFDQVFAEAAAGDFGKAAGKYNWLLFASINAVESAAARLEQLGKLAQIQLQLSVAAVGESTVEAARAHMFSVVFCPNEFKGAALVQQFPGYPNLSDVKMIWPRTDVGPTYTADELCKVGAQVDIVTCYRTAPPQNQEETAKKLAGMLLERTVDVVTLNSAQTARNFFELLKRGLNSLNTNAGAAPLDIKALLAPVTIASIGPETSATAEQLLGKVDIEAKVHTVAGLIEELTSCLGS
jgi:uroporphyrinogen-III synthase